MSKKWRHPESGEKVVESGDSEGTPQKQRAVKRKLAGDACHLNFFPNYPLNRFKLMNKFNIFNCVSVYYHFFDFAINVCEKQTKGSLQ